MYYVSISISSSIIIYYYILSILCSRIYWTERTTAASYPTLKYLNLSSSPNEIESLEDVAIATGLSSLAMGVDIRTDCVYVAKPCNRSTCVESVHTPGSELCDNFEVSIRNS